MLPNIIQDTANLKAFCEKLLSDPTGFITLDTEFARQDTYWAKLCLVQIASQEHQALIDPLAKDIDLTPLRDLLCKSRLLKVFHAARQDLEIFYHLWGCLPTPLFDTQVAAKACGFGESVGYGKLVEELTPHKINKSCQFTNWQRRPLSDAQQRYAMEDVVYLREVYEKLLDMLATQKRQDWVTADMQALLDPNIYRLDPQDAWKRFKLRGRSKKHTGCLRVLATWREQHAQAMNIPRQRILRDSNLIDLAAHPPKTVEELAATLIKLTSIKKLDLQDLFEALTNPPTIQGEEDQPAVKLKAPRLVHDMLLLWLNYASDQSGAAPSLIASQSELRAFINDPEGAHPFMTGWRFEAFGRDALALLRGQKAICHQDGGIKLIEIETTITHQGDL